MESYKSLKVIKLNVYNGKFDVVSRKRNIYVYNYTYIPNN